MKVGNQHKTMNGTLSKRAKQSAANITEVNTAGGFAMARRVTEPRRRLPGGWQMQDVLWCYGDCMYADGKAILPDAHGICWHQGEGYYLRASGRESQFALGKPNLRPVEGLYGQAGKYGEHELRPGRHPGEAEAVGDFFGRVCTAFRETAGGYAGYHAMGMMFAYAARPEILAKYGTFPGLWLEGEAAAGKTRFAEWLMHLQGFRASAGIGLRCCDQAGLAQQLENYSSLALWGDEYRPGLGKAKDALIRASTKAGAKPRSAKGARRPIGTTLLMVGEAPPGAGMGSRFSSVHLSAAQRRGDHMNWMEATKDCFFVFWRLAMERREEFVALLACWLEAYLRTELPGMDARKKLARGIGYGGWKAMSSLIERGAFAEFMRVRQ